MYDDRCLVDLINKRFDDMNQSISTLKADVIRQQAQHELHDVDRFEDLSERLKGFEKLKWTIMGAASAAFVVIQAASQVFEHFYLK